MQSEEFMEAKKSQFYVDFLLRIESGTSRALLLSQEKRTLGWIEELWGFVFSTQKRLQNRGTFSEYELITLTHNRLYAYN